MPDVNTLSKPLEFFRSATDFADSPGDVKTDGGKHGAGIIYGVSMITVGEALGHDMWCDEIFLASIVDAMNEVGDSGLKARFTHPGMCSDGMGKFLGRFENPVLVDGKVLADLHFSEAAHIAPDGDLAEYVMKLSQTDPDMFGTSIVFSRDLEAETEFTDSNEIPGEGFESPDETNTRNLLHCRLLKLRACDVVDTPAANPDGLFSLSSGAELTKSIDAFASYILLNDDQERPELNEQFQVDPDRAKLYFANFLDRHDLEIKTKGDQMPKELEAEEPKTEDFAANLKKYTTEFGSERGVEYFQAGKTFEEALQAELKFQKEEISSQSETIDELKDTVESLNVGEDEGAGFTGDKEKPVKFADLFKVK